MSESFEDQPLGYLLSRVMFALKSDVSAAVLDPLEVAFPEYLCMRVLSKYPGQSNADLARALSVSPQAMNMRSLPAQLTREGADLLKRTDAGVRAAENRLMVNMTDEERDHFKRTLAALGSDPI